MRFRIVDILETTWQGKEPEQRTIVRCVLEEGGSEVELSGDPEIIASLRAGDSALSKVLPSQGEFFMRALLEAYRAPQLLADERESDERPPAL